MSQRRRAPKRKITRIFSRIMDLDVDASATTNMLFTADDPVTLVWTIIELYAQPIGATAGLHRLDVRVALRPGGSSVGVAVGVSQSLANVERKQVLFRRLVTHDKRSDVDIGLPIQISADIKGNRTMLEGDLWTLSRIASAASEWALGGYIVQFFKEA